MHPKTKDLSGREFGRLTVLRFVGMSDNHKALWECRCQCGKIQVVKANTLLSGKYRAKCQCVSSRPVAEVFWCRVVKSEGCWEWSGMLLNGYGAFKYRRKMIYAHRFSYELHNGPILDGLCVCHHCDNPKCVRPDHFFLGTKADNCRDMAKKGRNATRDLHGSAKLDSSKVSEIRARWEAGETRNKLAREYGVTWRSVDCVVRGVTWKFEGVAESVHTS